MANRTDTLLSRFRAAENEIDDRLAHTIRYDRTGRGEITVVDKDGHPVENARIHVTLRDHDFKLGANIFMLDEFESAEKNRIYRDVFADTFNLATVPFYWSDLEPGRANRALRRILRMYIAVPRRICVSNTARSAGSRRSATVSTTMCGRRCGCRTIRTA